MREDHVLSRRRRPAVVLLPLAVLALVGLAGCRGKHQPNSANSQQPATTTSDPAPARDMRPSPARDMRPSPARDMRPSPARDQAAKCPVTADGRRCRWHWLPQPVDGHSRPAHYACYVDVPGPDAPKGRTYSVPKCPTPACCGPKPKRPDGQ